MPASHLLIFSKMVSPGTQVQDPVLCMVKFKIISAAWGKICGQIPQRGDSRSVQILQLLISEALFTFPVKRFMQELIQDRSLLFIKKLQQPYFCLILLVIIDTCSPKITLASVHGLAKHLHAMSMLKSRYEISN